MRDELYLKLTQVEVRHSEEFKVNKIFSSDLVLFDPLYIPLNPKWELLICQKGSTFGPFLSQPEEGSTKGLVSLVWEFG